ncbi:MAG: ribonucleoside-diphosphate reductase subunit alpha [Acidimicrobiales bacterium]|nr:ribonucleoside-diphosphate reductase subunit alpha [Acidimicrobiales bacterium]
MAVTEHASARAVDVIDVIDVTDEPITPVPGSSMRVRKRDGSLEPVDVNKIVRAVSRGADGLAVDPLRVATRTISGLYDGASSEELDQLSIRTAAALIAEEPDYSRLAARMLNTCIDKEVRNQDIYSFSQSIKLGHDLGLIGDATARLVAANSRKLNDAVLPDRSWLFEFFGLRTVYDRYLLRHPDTRQVIETPQYFFLRVACGLSRSANEAVEFYRLISSLDYLPSSPTLFNSGTTHSQMSSCYLLDSPLDELEAIYHRYTDVARLSKHAGGIGLAFHRVRSRGSLIKGTNGLSNGIVPWLKTLDSSVAAVNQGGRRKGAACVYLETWHADIEEFLELRDGTGDEGRRARNINLANWVPDLFMERVERDWVWSLFDPKKVPHLTDLYGEEFERAYVEAEEAGLFERQVPARELYARMMRTLAQTGNGWMTFKDASNTKCNQTGRPGNVVHLSNLCTEILEVTSQGETAVCNLGSVNLGHFVTAGGFDFERLGEVVRVAVRYLDRVIDINYYPTDEAAASNARWRPVGLGLMGLQDVLFRLRLPFDSDEARALSLRISEEMYFHALWASTELAEADGPHAAFAETRAAAGRLQFDLWGVEPTDPARWAELRGRIAAHGLRNSLLVAIAPTATIASIAGCFECIEPQVSNLFKRETLSGEFLQINCYLVRDLQARGLWTEAVRNEIKKAEGSVQHLADLPDDVRLLYRTVWEIPQRSLIDMAADRGAFIDQSQSLNLFVETPSIGKLSSMYAYAWKKGLKTTYYLRSRPATRIAQTTTTAATAYTDGEAVACSLENPETCEACD